MKIFNTALLTTFGLLATKALGQFQQILLQDPLGDELTFKEKANPFDWAIVTHAAFPSIQLRYREPDLCETTEGVNQYAGYLDIDEEDKVNYYVYYEKIIIIITKTTTIIITCNIILYNNNNNKILY